MGHPMKSNKGTPSAKGSKTAKVTPAPQGSKKLKASPGAKAAPTRKAKALPVDVSAPQDSAAPPVEHTAREIAARAYLNYQKRGASEGSHTEDWLQAEAELTAERLLVRA